MIDERRLLHHLEHGPCTGQVLADALGLSRAAIWKRVQALRAAGLEISADRRCGYALAAPLDLLDADTIRSLLPRPVAAALPELAVCWSLDSTQAALLRRDAAAPLPAVLLAERQSAGRGRRGRVWVSPLAAHLYLSLAWRFDLPLARLAGLSLGIGMAVVDALRAQGIAGIGLKWPNDLLAEGRKLGGIVVDVSGEVGGPVTAVIGIGINVRMPDAAASTIDQPWCDLMRLSDDKPPPRNVLAAAVIAQVLPALSRFADQGLPDIIARWPGYDALAGQAVRVDDARSVFDAEVLGLANDGGLRVRTTQGDRVLYSGEVSVRGAGR
ncbi:MAG: biotin--[acetyl-CoA-carboxylase] ligase [Xanthomonadaceae bacterium]|nr:biotin--[acetyl-CoA-carboxylase] ligase [Xanthomonadaceae bacterium]MDP2185302.1 biotin--[acetyl-CoA-carboxylase] ligase [Xanthomonadales bacterium]MDZ4115840.1 biotin--[acetyl-CoA-carboxylase] ligase [Xanthomonadaceae bacterium]MDZ4378670.1 biotin--[acetyl-CoA-carboxylase] ligase [Xanthomonadaceae bacterium]